MKNTFIISVFVTLVVQSNGQTFSEWFRQKKTQKKYLIEQMAALQVYTEFLENGYSIVKEGLSKIKDIKQGDYDLHSSYFSSLKDINPIIKSYKKSIYIVELKLEIQGISKKVSRQLKSTKVFNSDQREYIKSVFEKLLGGCETDVQLLLQLLTPNLLSLQDDERLNRIDQLYDETRNKYFFARTFENYIKQLQLGSMVNEREFETMLGVFDIKM
jgi:hypothetical protein